MLTLSRMALPSGEQNARKAHCYDILAVIWHRWPGIVDGSQELVITVNGSLWPIAVVDLRWPAITVNHSWWPEITAGLNRSDWNWWWKCENDDEKRFNYRRRRWIMAKQRTADDVRGDDAIGCHWGTNRLSKCRRTNKVFPHTDVKKQMG